jgi:hypothetical protein
MPGFPENRENNREFLKSVLQLMEVFGGFSESSSWPFPKLCSLTFNYY